MTSTASHFFPTDRFVGCRGSSFPSNPTLHGSSSFLSLTLATGEVGGVDEEGRDGSCFSISLGVEEGGEKKEGGGVELESSTGVGVEESVTEDCRDVRD